MKLRSGFKIQTPHSTIINNVLDPTLIPYSDSTILIQPLKHALQRNLLQVSLIYLDFFPQHIHPIMYTLVYTFAKAFCIQYLKEVDNILRENI
ncbi:hypothetical protein FGO68_gene704 [Halteria grandinella]|uniref:Uncharacterized protein n=1 Tax=Halteria grandinella TaxID=5974 RepID=A0A8J8NNX3_HALGN|nr:hypothetical protein FGO68_gene704 [Halteria grandinella]